MKKRVMAVLSVLLILAIVFTGCAAPAQSSEPAQTQAATEAPKTEAPGTDAPATTPAETAGRAMEEHPSWMASSRELSKQARNRTGSSSPA